MSKGWEAYAKHIRDTIEKIERIQQRGNLAQDEVLLEQQWQSRQS